jgi:hypothetical protein
MKNKLLIIAVFAGGSLFGQVSIGIRIGPPPPPPRVIAVRPVSPGPGFYWVEGYQYPVGNRYKWHSGYWTRPPYEGAAWVSPRYEGNQFYEGRWEGPRGPMRHDHHWDRGRNKDYGHDRDHDNRR